MHEIDGLGSAIKSARKSKHMTQKQLAEKLRITTHYLMSIENKRQIPSGELLFRIIRELEIPADTIFYPERKKNDDTLQQLQVLLRKCDERDIAVVTATLQSLLQEKQSAGGEIHAALDNAAIHMRRGLITPTTG
jgi:transcriptional regulator with XRE-family HTH domain